MGRAVSNVSSAEQELKNATLNFSLRTRPSIAILPRWNLDFSFVQVQSCCASAFGASKMGSAKTKRRMTSTFDRDLPRLKVNARKCHPGIHSRSRPRPNSSVSLSTVPRLSVRFRTARPGDLESQFWPQNPAFSRFSRWLIAIVSQRVPAFPVITRFSYANRQFRCTYSCKSISYKKSILF